jgi:hypothetical protein
MAQNQFVGQQYKKVAQELSEKHVPFRIHSRDGNAYCGTCDCVPGRYNFDVKNDIIVSQFIE